MGMNDILDDIKETIAEGEGLLAFCAQIGKNLLTVTRVFKHRTEVSLSELPIIMMTRPTKKNTILVTGEKAWVNTVRLYCGLNISNRDNAQALIVSFEELIEAALSIYGDVDNLPDYCLSVEPQSSANDEGMFHPVYFIVKDVEVVTAEVPETEEEPLLKHITTEDNFGEKKEYYSENP